MTNPAYRSWPFKEAQKLQKRFAEPPHIPVRFETGFGPSGMPHIGTFAEVARTTWVRYAFEFLTQWSTQLITFSDDMDGLRKVPLNLPQQEMLAENLGKPLCRIPDPFGDFQCLVKITCHAGFRHWNIELFHHLTESVTVFS